MAGLSRLIVRLLVRFELELSVCSGYFQSMGSIRRILPVLDVVYVVSEQVCTLYHTREGELSSSSALLLYYVYRLATSRVWSMLDVSKTALPNVLTVPRRRSGSAVSRARRIVWPATWTMAICCRSHR